MFQGPTTQRTPNKIIFWTWSRTHFFVEYYKKKSPMPSICSTNLPEDDPMRCVNRDPTNLWQVENWSAIKAYYISPSPAGKTAESHLRFSSKHLIKYLKAERTGHHCTQNVENSAVFLRNLRDLSRMCNKNPNPQIDVLFENSPRSFRVAWAVGGILVIVSGIICLVHRQRLLRSPPTKRRDLYAKAIFLGFVFSLTSYISMIAPRSIHLMEVR